MMIALVGRKNAVNTQMINAELAGDGGAMIEMGSYRDAIADDAICG
jgi:hypothetical protein